MPTAKIQSVTRAFQILHAFDAQRSFLTSAEIAERVGLNVKTVHRFLLTLESIGAVSRSGRGRFCLGMALVDLGGQVSAHRVLSEAAQHHLEELAETYNEATQAAVLDGADIMSIAHIPSTHSLTIGIRVGKRWPAYCTAVGKSMLADMDENVLRKFVSNINFERRTSYTITSARSFIKHIHQVREQGYSLNDQESEMGMRGIAVPVKNSQSRTIAAISISGPATRLTLESILALKDNLQTCATHITQELYGTL